MADITTTTVWAYILGSVCLFALFQNLVTFTTKGGEAVAGSIRFAGSVLGLAAAAYLMR